MAYDPYWNNVVLAMHMDDAGLTDLKGHTVTLTGNAARSATQSKFGGYSAAFDGAGDLASVASSSDFAFGTGDFTIEFWYRQTVAGEPFLLDFRPNSSTNGAYVTLFITSSSAIVFYVNAAARITSAVTVTTGTWYHVAVCRSGTSTRLFINGVQTGSTYTDSTSYISSPVNIGASGNLAFVLNGYIDDLRITKGVARYTADFSVPTEAFPNRPPQLHGTVKDQYGNFAARAVRAYKRSTGALSDSDTSSASDGAFTLDAADDTVHYVICLDDDINENALIFDNLTPV